MDTELKPTVHYKRSKSKGSLPDQQLVDIDENNDDDETEDAFLIKKTNRLNDYKRNSSPFYGSNLSEGGRSSRNINTPVYNPSQDEDFEEFSQSIKKKSTFTCIKCPKIFNKLLSPANQISKFFKKYAAYFTRLKQILLVSYCAFCVLIFGLYDNAEDKYTQTVISNKSETHLGCHGHSSHPSAYYRVRLFGPFVSLEDLSRHEINSGIYVNINFFSSEDLSKPIADTWKLVVKLPDDVHHNNASRVNEYSDNGIDLKNIELDKEMKSENIVIVIDTNEKSSVAFVFNCEQLSPKFKYSILFSAILLVFVYVLIMFELTHRTLAAFMGSLGGLTLLAVVEMEKPSLLTIVTWVEWETILLMFGMMIIVGVFCETGLFDLLAFRIFHYSGSRIWVMISSLCLFSALLSAFLDNVTTILLLTPITIRLCEVMGLDARYIIIAEVIFSNIGGVSTAIGDPPNVIITANQIINDRGIDFANFTAHMFVGTLFIYASTFLQYRLLFFNPSCFLRSRETEHEEMRKEITIWTRTYQSITPITKEEKIVKTLLKEKVSQLESLLSQSISKSAHDLEESLNRKSKEMIENYRIHDKKLLIICSTVFSMTLLLFFIHPFIDSFHLTVGWIAALSSLILLVSALSGHHGEKGDKQPASIDIEAVLHKVEWATLLFFAGLFIFMRCIEELGLLKFLANFISDLIKAVENESDRLVFAILMLILVSALISSLIDNIPFTTAMIPIIIQLSEQADLPLQPLVYALAFGSCLGGNGTLIGASCNLVAAGIAEQHGIKITFKQFFQTAFPIMINSVLVAIIYMCITSIYLKWY